MWRTEGDRTRLEREANQESGGLGEEVTGGGEELPGVGAGALGEEGCEECSHLGSRERGEEGCCDAHGGLEHPGSLGSVGTDERGSSSGGCGLGGVEQEAGGGGGEEVALVHARELEELCFH